MGLFDGVAAGFSDKSEIAISGRELSGDSTSSVVIVACCPKLSANESTSPERDSRLKIDFNCNEGSLLSGIGPRFGVGSGEAL